MKKIGIYNPYLDTKGGGEKVCLALASVLSNQSGTEVWLITHKKVQLNSLSKYFNLNLSKVNVQVVNVETFSMKVLAHLPLPGGIKHLFNDIKIFRKVRKVKYDLFINNCFQSNLPGPSQNNVYMCMFPQRIHHKKQERGIIYVIYSAIVRNVYRLILHPTKSHAVYTYNLITANSAFTQKYIKKYWNLDSEILYPICENMEDKSVTKRKMILNVGRFFEKGENHHKRHDFLVSTFAKMIDFQKEGWELHIAGSVTENVDTLKYLLALIKLGSGLPVYFHFNASFAEIKKLYNQSTIYWHATGYGSDPARRPETQEHFGISTVEAMSAGAIPIVINSAGQKEIVSSNVNGFLWTDEPSLVELTKNVLDLNPNKRDNLTKLGKQTAILYDDSAFLKRSVNIFRPYIS